MSGNSIVSQTLSKPSSGYGDPRRKDGGGKKRGFARNHASKDRGPRTKPGSNGPGNNPAGFAANGSQTKRVYSASNGKGKQSNDDEMVSDADVFVEAKVLSRQSDTKYQQFTPTEISATGPLVANAETLGFKRKAQRPREISKFLQSQPRLLIPIPFQQHAWDKQNQDKMLQMEQSGMDNQGLYEAFQKMRDTERKEMESLGLVDAENIRKDLNDAISFQGTCVDMCPTFERVRRAYENNVKALEKDPATNKIARDKAVKAFSRPAAGQPPPLPSDVRPPHILKKTLDYLVSTIVSQLPEAHSFIWDRTRSIRQDFTYQNYFGPEAIDCNERIVRIHLVCLHVMAGSDVEYSQQQELEQFNKALQTLVEIYQDVRNRGGSCPNEAEFRAYYLLSHIRDAEVERELQTLPDIIFNDKLIQLALKIRKLAAHNNIVERGHKNTIGCLNLFVEFFKLVYSDDTPFLVACLLETHFNEIRFYALKAMSRGYHTRGKPYDADALRAMLGFDTLEELTKFVSYYEIDIIEDENDGLLIDLFNKDKLESKYKLNSITDKPKYTQTYSEKLNNKIHKPLAEFIDSGKPNTNLRLKNVKDMSILKKPRQVNVRQEEAKSGSFADFLSKSTLASGTSGFTPGGFGSSINNADKIDVTELPKPPNVQLDQSTGKAATHSATEVQAPAGSFKFTQNQQSTDKPSTAQTSHLNFAKAESQPASKPLEASGAANFNFQPQQSKPNFAPPTSKPPVFTFSLPKVEEVNRSSLVESISSKDSPAPGLPVSVEKPAPPPKKKTLLDSPQYDDAIREIYHQIFDSVVNEELDRILPTLIRKKNVRSERSRVIKSLAKELYDAFLNEILFKQILDVKAEKVYENNLKIKTLKRIKKKGEELQRKQVIKRKRLNELDEIKFHGLKRQVSNSSNTSFASKRRNINNSIDNIIEKRHEIESLWQPLDLKAFLQRCTNNIRISIESQNLRLKFLLLVENWRKPYSRWLGNKLQLKLNKEKMIYEHTLESDKINLEMISLPPKDQLSRSFFKNTNFILFECGLVDNGGDNIKAKLARDRGVLAKILDLASQFGHYKIQVLILFWDSSKSGIAQPEVREILKVDSTALENVKQVVVCDMTQDVNDSLKSGITQLAEGFNGELTSRGKKSQPIKRPAVVKPTISDEKFKDKEHTLLQKARLDKKYSYLANHSMLNNSFNRSNTTLANNSLLRHTFNRSMRTVRNDANSTTYNVSNVLNNSNMSILDGFGTGIIEESTPFSSPKKITKPAPSSKAVPKSLQQLMELTNKVKSKYK